MERDSYFDLPGISNSDLKHFKRSPEHYRQYKDNPPEQTEAMAFGSAFHCLVLEPEKFPNCYTIMNERERPFPDKDYRTVANNDWKKNFLAECFARGIQVLTKWEYDTIHHMRDKLYSVPQSKELLEFTRNEYEVPMQWYYNKVKCKGKKDISNEIFIADLKTTKNADPIEFHKTVIWDDLYRQAGMYIDGDAGGRVNYNKLKEFYFIAIEKEAPYGVSVNVCSPELIEAGIEEYRSLVMQLSACYEMDIWQSYEYKALTRMDGIHEIQVPYFLKD